MPPVLGGVRAPLASGMQMQKRGCGMCARVCVHTRTYVRAHIGKGEEHELDEPVKRGRKRRVLSSSDELKDTPKPD